MADYDLAVIGGGLNGVSVARDAAGRGLRVILLEQGDLASAASSATSRLIHGDLAVLERRRFRRVRAQLAERGAEIRTGARCVRADRGDTWRLAVIDRGHRRVITARAVANTTGAWTGLVAETILRLPAPKTAAIQISQIVVPRLFESDNVYV